jgi:hypothetical protein
MSAWKADALPLGDARNRPSFYPSVPQWSSLLPGFFRVTIKTTLELQDL